MQHLQPNTTLQGGKFRIERVLGQGTFGITYLATTTTKAKAVISGDLGEIEEEGEVIIKVAIKEFFMNDLNKRSSDGSRIEESSSQLVKDYRKKFRREAENLSHLNHSNIVKVLEVFDANNTTYYAMRYINGQSLDEYISTKGKLDEEEAIRIIKPIAEALQYMHDSKMLHLDLKPKNIMLDKNLKPYIIDFGLSKQYDENGDPESSTTIGLGTPGYAPIEQANYKQDGSFPATLDVYALGATLYKMLTGETPPDASTVFNEGLPALPDTISQSTRDAINQAMQPRKKDRPKSINTFLELLNNEPTADNCIQNRDETIISGFDEETILDIGNDKKEESPSPRIPKGKTVKDYTMIYMLSSIGLIVVFLLAFLFFVKHSPSNDSADESASLAQENSNIVHLMEYKTSFGSCHYSGPVDNESNPNGIGEAFFFNNRDYEYYKGNFNHGTISGKDGYLKFANGDVFEGEFLNNELYYGKITYSKDESYFIGSFKNDKPHEGTKYDKKGEAIETDHSSTTKKNNTQQEAVSSSNSRQTHTDTANHQNHTSQSNNTVSEETIDNEIYQVVDQMPVFPEGGMNGLKSYLSANIRYPANAAENGVQGTVTVQFVVNRDGSIVDVSLLRRTDPDLDREAIRVVNSMPKWKPGMHHGKPVRVRYTMPINFRLQ